MTSALYIVLTSIVALITYVFVGGPRLPAETDDVISEVLASELPELVEGETGFAISDGLNIWYECISPYEPSKATVVLSSGLGGSALEWPATFVGALVSTGYSVVRYDHRGTGWSDRVETWNRKNPYLVSDLASDAIAVMDALELKRAHFVGLSMGGMVAQAVATAQSERVLSLTLLMTSGDVGDPDLPQLSSRYVFASLAMSLPLLRYRILGGERNLIKERLAKVLVFLGPDNVDIREIAELVLYDLRNRGGLNIGAILQHQAAVAASGSRYEALAALDTPVLVIHGTDDSIFPIEHGMKLAEVIPNAKSFWLQGVGHGFPVPNMEQVIQVILEHLDQSQSEMG